MRKPETAGEVDQKLAVKTLGMKAKAKRRAEGGQAQQQEAAVAAEKAAAADAPAPDDRLSGSASGGRRSFRIR